MLIVGCSIKLSSENINIFVTLPIFTIYVSRFDP